MAKFIRVTSTQGFTNVRNFEGNMYVPFEDVECDTCATVGGYCGHCSGHCWSEVHDLPPEESAYNVAVEHCPHCGDAGYSHTLTEAEYAAEERRYSSAWEDCPVDGCGAPRGHSVTPL